MDDLQRLALYQYLEAAIAGRSVLEIGCGAGLGLIQLGQLGAARVAGVDPDPEIARQTVAARSARVDLYSLQPKLQFAADASYDLVCVTDARLCRDRPGLVAEVSHMMAPDGRAAFLTPSGDHPDLQGLTYGELLDLLEDDFAEIRIVGLCPMSAVALVELREDLDPEDLDVALDGSLMGGVVEEVEGYLAWCRQDDVPDERDRFPYGIVQVPVGGLARLRACWGLGSEADRGGEARARDKRFVARESADRGRLRERWRWPAFLRRADRSPKAS